MKPSLYLFFVLFFLALAPAAQAVGTLQPKGEWRVYTQQGLCVARIEMGNGFILAFSGPKGGPAPQRLSVDFRQDAFSVGQTYAARVNGSGLLAQGVGPAVLAVPLPADYRRDEPLTLEVEGNAFTFALPGLGPVLADFPTCGLGAKPVPDPAIVAQAPTSAPKPQAKPESKPKPIVVDFTRMEKGPASRSSSMAPESLASDVVRASGSVQTAALRRDVEVLSAKNLRLERELEAARAEAALQRRGGLGGKDWSLEEAAARYEESERQVRRLGDQIERERLAFQKDKEDLEALLFDPAVTEQKQMAKLADLEQQLEGAKAEAARTQARHEAQVANMERQLAGAPQ